MPVIRIWTKILTIESTGYIQTVYINMIKTLKPYYIEAHKPCHG